MHVVVPWPEFKQREMSPSVGKKREEYTIRTWRCCDLDCPSRVAIPMENKGRIQKGQKKRREKNEKYLPRIVVRIRVPRITAVSIAVTSSKGEEEGSAEVIFPPTELTLVTLSVSILFVFLSGWVDPSSQAGFSFRSLLACRSLTTP